MKKITIKKIIKDESAVTSIEYALVACLIALAVIPFLGFIGNRLAKLFREITKIIVKH